MRVCKTSFGRLDNHSFGCVAGFSLAVLRAQRGVPIVMSCSRWRMLLRGARVDLGVWLTVGTMSLLGLRVAHLCLLALALEN